MMLEFPLLSYVVLMSITPGPNNLMLAASGVNFGFRRSLPHLLGVSSGHGVQVLLVSLLLGWVMQWLDSGRLLLSVPGCLYLFWLSWQVWRAAAPRGQAVPQPMTLASAAAFQWVNPKAWVMVVNTVLLFLPAGAGAGQAWWLALVCALVNFPCICIWAALGEGLRRYLSQPHARRWFNGVMAVLMAATAIYLLRDELKLSGVW